jgi:hypothetical protein
MMTVSDQVIEKIKTHVLCSITFFSENYDVYEITWANMIDPERPGIKI